MGNIQDKIILAIMSVLEGLEKVGIAKTGKPTIRQEMLEMLHNKLKVLDSDFDKLKKEYEVFISLGERAYTEYQRAPHMGTIKKYAKYTMAKRDKINEIKSNLIRQLKEI